jgi:hypothetical protein
MKRKKTSETSYKLNNLDSKIHSSVSGQWYNPHHFKENLKNAKSKYTNKSLTKVKVIVHN